MVNLPARAHAAGGSKTAAERSAIEVGRARVQMSVAAYCGALGTGYSPSGKVELRADLGRLGELLKLWLTDRAGDRGGGRPGLVRRGRATRGRALGVRGGHGGRG